MAQKAWSLSFVTWEIRELSQTRGTRRHTADRHGVNLLVTLTCSLFDDGGGGGDGDDDGVVVLVVVVMMMLVGGALMDGVRGVCVSCE